MQKNRWMKISEHKDLILIGLVALNLLLTVIMSGSAKKTYFLTSGKEIENPELENFCLSFINQVISRNLQREMVEPDIFDVLVEDNYQVLKLVGSEATEFSRAKADQCSVIVKDKLGLRRFDIWVNKSFENPLYYRARKIDEPGIEG